MFDPKCRFMNRIILLLMFVLMGVSAYCEDMLPGFERKLVGEEIIYFSPLHEFANKALLTRCNGSMPISWVSPNYSGDQEYVVYNLLMGHSTGTSGGNRHFEVSLNGRYLFDIETKPKLSAGYTFRGFGSDSASYVFMWEEFDVNQDGFGKLFLKVKADWVRTQAHFQIKGKQEESRDWLMIFDYTPQLKVIAQATNLVTRIERKRQLNFLIDNPYKNNTSLHLIVQRQVYRFNLKNGYNKLSLPAYDISYVGIDTLLFIVNKKDSIYKPIVLKPIRDFEFHIIHHSHNDIGYSHLQTEVEVIQTNNIRSAMRWMLANTKNPVKPYWHVESLWAVENFLRGASKEEKTQFFDLVKKGQMVLSANYANILTGLCKTDELNWALEYADSLERTYGIQIKQVMTTDIPGISWGGLKSYTQNGISYLSMGPNYVASLPDRGDRVGSVIKEQGDKAFYWKPDSASNESLLVWTAGKGYSYFHGVTESEKFKSWEQRISDYCVELVEENYPYEMVQLRYTKKSDNGPVDTTLCDFVSEWNKRFLYPKLTLNSIENLFDLFAATHGKDLPIVQGEISPYWEDGAYSTAIEEMDARTLVKHTLAMESYLQQSKLLLKDKKDLYKLHRNLVLFHEHTWGSWCSISDPELFFTQEQWRIKKSFLDSAHYYYQKLSVEVDFKYAEPTMDKIAEGGITHFEVDMVHGGIAKLVAGKVNLVQTETDYKLFEPIYVLGLQDPLIHRAKAVKVFPIQNNRKQKVVMVTSSLPTMDSLVQTYVLNKRTGVLTCKVKFFKTKESKKESFHLAIPLASDSGSVWQYGSKKKHLNYQTDRLPGSNNEFVCVEEEVLIQVGGRQMVMKADPIALYEVGNLIDERQVNGAKVWKREPIYSSNLFLYVYNNYWHTNYKAYQEGWFEFEVELQLK
jgi:alpha-mannosidase